MPLVGVCGTATQSHIQAIETQLQGPGAFPDFYGDGQANGSGTARRNPAIQAELGAAVWFRVYGFRVQELEDLTRT